MALTTFNYGKRPLGHGEGGGVGNAFQTLMCRIDYRDVAAAAVYNIFDLPAGAFVTACYFAVETAWVGTSMTMVVDESTGAGTYIAAGLGTVANMETEGSVLKGHTYLTTHLSVLATGAGDDAEFDTSARTVDFTSGGGTAWTAGVGVLVIEYIIIPQ